MAKKSMCISAYRFLCWWLGMLTCLHARGYASSFVCMFLKVFFSYLHVSTCLLLHDLSMSMWNFMPLK